VCTVHCLYTRRQHVHTHGVYSALPVHTSSTCTHTRRVHTSSTCTHTRRVQCTACTHAVNMYTHTACTLHCLYTRRQHVHTVCTMLRHCTHDTYIALPLIQNVEMLLHHKYKPSCIITVPSIAGTCLTLSVHIFRCTTATVYHMPTTTQPYNKCTAWPVFVGNC